MQSVRRLLTITGYLVATLGVAPAAEAQDQAPSVDGLTTRQLVGQRLILGYAGSEPPARLTRRIARGEAAGVILFTRNVRSRAALRRTVARLQAIQRPVGLRQPLLIMIDQEGGAVKRLSGAPSRTPAQVGATKDPAYARRVGRATAANLREVGVNVNLAPVLDIGRPGSIVRRLGRSYGSTAGQVQRTGVPFAQGLGDGNVLATAKHFPGIGDARIDEDVAPNRSTRSLSFLREVDMAPFAAAFRARVPMVMTSTSIYTALDRDRPALLSRRVATTELRDRLRFTGVSITDDLDVGALDRFGSAARVGLSAAEAGNDLLLYAQSYANGASAGAAILRAAVTGELKRSALEASAARILALRASLE
jgi:beta-N-acetylhexosaminidase